MTKSSLTLAAAAVLSTGLAAVPSASLAQSRTAEIIVYGTDPCPRSTDDEVVVCRRLPETQRYRIAEELRTPGTRQERQAWVNQSRALQTVGATGTNTCSPVGPGGHTGCIVQEIELARQQRQEQAAADVAPEQ